MLADPRLEARETAYCIVKDPEGPGMMLGHVQYEDPCRCLSGDTPLPARDWGQEQVLSGEPLLGTGAGPKGVPIIPILTWRHVSRVLAVTCRSLNTTQWRGRLQGPSLLGRSWVRLAGSKCGGGDAAAKALGRL